MIYRQVMEHYGTQQKMADAIGCSQTLVWRWLNGKATMPTHFALKVEKITGGKFKAVDLCPRLAEIENIKPQAGTH